MRDIHALFADYAAYHQTAGNKRLHRIGIPLIMLGLIGMLARVAPVDVPGMRLDLAMILIVGASIYYALLDWRAAAAMLVISVACWFAGGAMPLLVNLGLFIGGWIVQFIGHAVYEKRQPAFTRNLVHLFVGPLWILNDLVPLVRREGIRE